MAEALKLCNKDRTLMSGVRFTMLAVVEARMNCRTTMRFARWIFLVAGIFGVLLVLPMYLLEAQIGRDLPPAITHPEYYYGFLGVALACQLLFLIVARDPHRATTSNCYRHARKLSSSTAVRYRSPAVTVEAATLSAMCHEGAGWPKSM